MTTPPSDPRGTAAPQRPARASYPTSGYPRARAVVWGAALLAGGLAMIVFFFFAIGVINLAQNPVLFLLMLAMALFFAVTMWSFARSERRGNSRWADRERRGF